LAFVILGNPNSPTGHTWEVESLKKLTNFFERKNILLIIDEALNDFCNGNFSLANEAARSKNLIVIHSLTKVFCIPGALLGFCSLH
jgi:histidinol-phosphate/aromatic aminotransferase/cobyric acid decarboxylase-like protein